MFLCAKKQTIKSHVIVKKLKFFKMQGLEGFGRTFSKIAYQTSFF